MWRYINFALLLLLLFKNLHFCGYPLFIAFSIAFAYPLCAVFVRISVNTFTKTEIFLSLFVQKRSSVNRASDFPSSPLLSHFCPLLHCKPELNRCCCFCRELRYNRNDAATLMNLCLALTVAVIVFVVGITRTDNQLLCKSFAVLLHYFLLCGLLWLGCGGACLTSLLKKGSENEEYNPVLKYYLVAWGKSDVNQICCHRYTEPIWKMTVYFKFLS